MLCYYHLFRCAITSKQTKKNISKEQKKSSAYGLGVLTELKCNQHLLKKKKIKRKSVNACAGGNK